MSNDKDLYAHLAYSNMLSHFFKTCRELDREFFGKEFLQKAANKTISPLHVSNVGIEKAIVDIFSLDSFITSVRPMLKKSLMEK